MARLAVTVVDLISLCADGGNEPSHPCFVELALNNTTFRTTETTPAAQCWNSTFEFELLADRSSQILCFTLKTETLSDLGKFSLDITGMRGRGGLCADRRCDLFLDLHSRTPPPSGLGSSS
eukprot:RCo010278